MCLTVPCRGLAKFAGSCIWYIYIYIHINIIHIYIYRDRYIYINKYNIYTQTDIVHNAEKQRVRPCLAWKTSLFLFARPLCLSRGNPSGSVSKDAWTTRLIAFLTFSWRQPMVIPSMAREIPQKYSEKCSTAGKIWSNLGGIFNGLV